MSHERRSSVVASGQQDSPKASIEDRPLAGRFPSPKVPGIRPGT